MSNYMGSLKKEEGIWKEHKVRTWTEIMSPRVPGNRTGLGSTYALRRTKRKVSDGRIRLCQDNFPESLSQILHRYRINIPATQSTHLHISTEDDCITIVVTGSRLQVSVPSGDTE